MIISPAVHVAISDFGLVGSAKARARGVEPVASEAGFRGGTPLYIAPELVSGVDIVAEQFRIASGGSISQLDIGQHGYAIEARVNAERVIKGPDGRLRFRPDPGQIVECVLPEESGIEVIAMAAPGKFVSPYYDSMVAQIIAHGTSRLDTIEKLERYLSRIRITGICTNIALLLRVLGDSVFRDGIYDTNYLPQLLARIDADALIRDIGAAAGKASLFGDPERDPTEKGSCPEPVPSPRPLSLPLHPGPGCIRSCDQLGRY